MRVLVCGGRGYRDCQHVWATLDAFDAKSPVAFLMEGGAATFDERGQVIGGADAFALSWATFRDVPHQRFKADWKTHGRAAGPIRNAKMIREGRPDVVIAFPGGRGTADMCRQAEAAGIPIVRPAPHLRKRGRGMGARNFDLGRPTKVRHRKRGTTYCVLGAAFLQTDTPLSDMAVLVVYQGEDGRMWARPKSEFEDGRFAILSESPKPGDAR